jgi:hypothetical protein
VSRTNGANTAVHVNCSPIFPTVMVETVTSGFFDELPVCGSASGRSAEANPTAADKTVIKLLYMGVSHVLAPKGLGPAARRSSSPSTIELGPLLHRRAAALAAKFGVVSPKLRDYEPETAARACGPTAHREGEGAAKISDPALRAPVQPRAQ